MDANELTHRLSWHPPTGDQEDRYRQIRTAAIDYAQLLNQLCPDGHDKALAVDHLEDCVSRAISAIANSHDTTGAGPTQADEAFADPAPPANSMADDILDWLREHPYNGDHIPTEPLTIQQDHDGTVRLVDVPGAFSIDVALLRHPGLRGVAFTDGYLTVEPEAVRYRALDATDFGFTVVFRRED